ncbi:MAG TPA: AraC family transcriptional regulator [Gemmatimonadales bacterium]|nr:AraC family transcriptional regulator [Gemmatimonadales bacterium]
MLAEAVHRDGGTHPEHAFAHTHFTVLLTGSFEELASGSGSRAMRPLSTAFSPPDFVHRDRIGRRGARLFTVWLGHQAADALLGGSECWHVPRLWDSAPVALPLLRLYAALARRPASLDPFEVEDCVSQVIETVRSRPVARETRRPRWVDGARERIADCPDSSLRVTDLAREAGVHPVHFSRTFRQFVGVRPAEYRAHARVAAGCRLAAATSLPLSEVALAAGFADQSHMTRAFGRVLGIAPAAYRALLREGADPRPRAMVSRRFSCDGS